AGVADVERTVGDADRRRRAGRHRVVVGRDRIVIAVGRPADGGALAQVAGLDGSAARLGAVQHRVGVVAAVVAARALAGDGAEAAAPADVGVGAGRAANAIAAVRGRAQRVGDAVDHAGRRGAAAGGKAVLLTKAHLLDEGGLRAGRRPGQRVVGEIVLLKEGHEAE